MDDNLRDVLIALITITGGTLTAYLVARVTSRADRRLEQDRWRRELYVRLLEASDNAARGGGLEAELYELYDVASRTLLNLQMLRAPAYSAGREMFNLVTELHGYNSGEKSERFLTARSAFIGAVAKDLGD